MTTNIESTTQEDPLFSFKNFIRPTAKNVLIWGTAIKGACITLISLAATIIFTTPSLSVALIIVAVVVGGIAESIVLFTREKPVETLAQAVEDVIEEKDKPLLPITILQPIVQPVNPECDAPSE